MSYNPKTWVNLELITAEDMNHIEQGIANEQVGPPGPAGTNGTNGTNGADGKSAYQIAVENGFVGTEAQWLDSLHGADGQNGAPGQNGVDGATGPKGDPGEGVPPGGTTGQMLVKASDTDFDTEWVNPPESGGGEGTSGVTTFNGRSGAVTPQPGDYTAEQVGARPNTWTPTAEQVGARPNTWNPAAGDVLFTPGDTGMLAENVQGAITELFTSVSDGKSIIASAITDKGVNTAADADFQTMADNIAAISSVPAGLHTITLQSNDPEMGSVSGGGMASQGMTVTVEAEAESGYKFTAWKESGEIVSEYNPYKLLVTRNIELTADFVSRKHGLPSGYIELEYIYPLNIGSQINTGARAQQQNAELYIDLTIQSNVSSDQDAFSLVRFAQYLSGKYRGVAFSANYNGDTYFQFFSNATSPQLITTESTLLSDSSLPKRTRILYRYNDQTNDLKTVFLNDLKKEIANTDPAYTNNGVTILGGGGIMDNKIANINQSSVRYHEVKITNNSQAGATYNVHLIPCKNPSGTVGMYDILNKTFKGPDSTTYAWGAGPEI